MNPHDDRDLDAFEARLVRLLAEDEADTELPAQTRDALHQMTREYTPDDARGWLVFGYVLVFAVSAAGLTLWAPLLLVGGVGLVGVVAATERSLRRTAGHGIVEALRSAARGG